MPPVLINGRFTLSDDSPRAGGLSEVRKVFDSVSGDFVAIELVDPPQGDDVIEVFLRRATEALGALQHPSIVRLLDSGWVPELGRYFLAFEWVDRSLTDDLDARRPYEWLEYFDRVGLPLAAALGYAHGRGIEHRDVKPGNVLVAADGVVKLADFGIAKIRAKVTDQEHRSGIYAPPEAEDFIPYVRDVFAFGVLAVRMLSAYEIGSFTDLEPALSSLASVPHEVRSVLLTCVALDPGERFQNAAVLEQKLVEACRVARRRESRQRNALWLGITRAAAGVVLGTDPQQEADFRRAEAAILDDLGDSLHTDYGYDPRSKQVNDKRILLAGRSMLLRVASDEHYQDRVRIIGAERKDRASLQRWRDKAVDLTRMVALRFEDPGAEAAADGLDFLLGHLDEHRAQQAADVSAPVGDRYEEWARLLDAREALARGEQVALRRQEDALVSVRTGRTVNPRLHRILRDPGTVQVGPAADVMEWFRDSLDESQRDVVRHALGSQDLLLVQGAPGTGKTTVIVEIVQQTIKRKPDARILVVSQTHAAVDSALERLAAAGVPGLVRLGRPDDPRVAATVGHLLVDQRIKKWAQEIRTRAAAFPREELRGEWLQRIDTDPMLVTAFLRTCTVVVGTALDFLGDPATRDLDFDLCVVDEASEATATEMLAPLARSRRWVLVGDPNQLPPMDENLLRHKSILKEYGLSQELVETTLFKYLADRTQSPVRHLLTEQWRMVPAIGNLISTCFYQGGFLSPSRAELAGYDKFQRPVLWIDTLGLGEQRRESRHGHDNTSIANPAEAAQVIEHLPRGEKLSVLLIAPYGNQVEELRRRVAGLQLGHLTVDVLSVDAVQGRECDIAIFSVTRSNDRRDVGFIGESYWRRITVALSRARFGLIIVGDAGFCRGRAGPLRDVLRYIDKHPEECEIRDAGQ